MSRLFSRFEPSRFLPYHSNFIDIDGVKLHYFDIGPRSEKAILLLHGNPTWSFYYRNLMRELAVHHRVIVPDYIGCGLSDHPTDRHYTARERVDHLERLLDHAGVKTFSLVMHDWGGPIGTSLAQRRVQRVERLVYLNTTLTETEHLPGFIRMAAHPWVGRYITQRTKRFLKLLVRFGVHRSLPPEIQQGYFFPYQTAARRTAIWDFVQDIPFDEHHPSYTELMEVSEKLPCLREKPVLIFWGLRDPCFHRSMLTQVSRHFPQAEVVEMANASHLVLEDVPEEAASTISRFLRGEARRGDDQGMEERSAPLPGVRFRGSALYDAAVSYAEAHPDDDALIVVEGQPVAARALVGGGDQEPLRSARMSLSELFTRVRQYERGLSQLGCRDGDRIIFLVPPGIEFLALSYAVMGRGAIPVFLDPGMGRENLLRCIADANPAGFIGAAKAHLLRWLKPSVFKGLRFSVAVSEIPLPGAYGVGFLKRFSPQPLPLVERTENAPGLIAFTSGATGTPKGVIFTNKMLKAQLEIFSSSLGLTPGTRDLPLLPVFSLFSLALGVGSVFAPLDPARPLELDPELMGRILTQFKVHSSFGSPTLWNKIAEFIVRHHETLPGIKRIYMAGAPVSPRVLALVQRAAPSAVVATPYGATEALPVTMVRAEELSSDQVIASVHGEVGTPVGRPVSGVEVRIIEASDKAFSSIDETVQLPALSIGEVIVRGNNVSPTYLHRPDATHVGKIPDGDTFWHRMGDTGYLDAEGRLYFCGRKAHVVKAGDRVYYSDPVERIFNEHQKVRRSALIGVRGGSVAAVAIEPLPEHFPKDPGQRELFVSELAALAQKTPLTQKIEKFYFHPSFPVDARHNAKIFRDRLSEWAERHGGDASV